MRPVLPFLWCFNIRSDVLREISDVLATNVMLTVTGLLVVFAFRLSSPVTLKRS